MCKIGLNQNCRSTLKIACKEGNFICSGVANKGTKYKDDRIWLCLKGQLCTSKLEMTKKEAAYFISVLAMSLAELNPSIIKKIK